MSTALLDFSEALVGAVASAAVSIVRVEGRERLPPAASFGMPKALSWHFITDWTGTRTSM